MKKQCSVLLFSILNCGFILAQKLDYTWIMGDNNYNKTSIFKYTNTVMQIDSSKYILPMNAANGSICDKDGNFLFFTNGLQIANKNFEIMKGGQRIVPSNTVSNQYLKTGMPDLQFCMVLPYVNDDKKYYLLYSDLDIVQFPDKKYYYTAFNSLYSTIDFNENPLGIVMNVDSIIFSDTLTSGQLAASRHGNGRDWWVILPGNQNYINHKLLINQNGLNYHSKQEIGSKNDKLFGQSLFTPDGNKFIRVSIKRIGKPSGVDIYDFDRCSGELSNLKQIILEDSLSVYTCGGAVSSNSRFLYVSYRNYIFQYDLESSDIASTKDTVAIYDKFIDPNTGFQIGFFLSQLAPDGKIYINTSNSTAWLHVIDKPDEKGKACNVIQHAVKLPTYHGFTMPNFPNYRLGPLKGSPCDTILGVANKDIKPENYGIKLFPNPSSTIIKIDITIPQYDPSIKTEVVVVDVSGAIVMRYVMPDFAYIAELDISKLPSGVYGVQLRQPQKSGTRVLATEKFVVID